MKYFFKRTLAYFIDCLIAFAIVMLVFQWGILSHIRASIGITDAWFTSSINMQLYVLTTISIPVWAYFTYFDSNKSKGTFGKRIFKFAVKDKDNQKISLQKSFLRTVFKLLPWEIAHIGVIFPYTSLLRKHSKSAHFILPRNPSIYSVCIEYFNQLKETIYV